ncbi:MAG: glycosyltransferase family 2 protein [Gammaproteobacteria bacterium]|nr:glycosyltransferase family 2 protein [Gammaproteobacteria bacterium]
MPPLPAPDDSRPVPGLAVSIVVPTLREAENLPALARRIEAALSGRGLEWELVLVDDDSRDGIEAVAGELARCLPVRLDVRRDSPRDLSRSVLRGIEISRFDRIVVMDADLSHPPARIPDLVQALDGECDMAVGSRYAPGGRIGRGWGLRRFLNSYGATLLARPLADCADPLSGFFALDRRSLPDLGELRPIGYKIGLEIMVRGRLRVAEVPIEFADRSRGSSKMDLRQQARYLRHLKRLYLHRFGDLARVLSFGMVGASGFVVDLVFYLGLQALGMEHHLARFWSFWPAVSWNWWLNRRVTFDERPWQPPARQWARFAIASLVGLGVNVGSYLVLTSFVDIFIRHPFYAFLLGIVLGGIINFLVSTLYVYRRHSGPNREVAATPPVGGR